MPILIKASIPPLQSIPSLELYVTLLYTVSVAAILYMFSVTIFGLVLGADNALLAYEEAQRHRENSIRREARIALAQQGIVPTETEIAKWKKAQNTQKI